MAAGRAHAKPPVTSESAGACASQARASARWRASQSGQRTGAQSDAAAEGAPGPKDKDTQAVHTCRVSLNLDYTPRAGPKQLNSSSGLQRNGPAPR